VSALSLLCAFTSAAAAAPTARELSANGAAALRQLYATTPEAKALGVKARAVLVFPRIVRAGFMIGGQTGQGVLLRGGRPVGYYKLNAAAYGLQAGAQTFSYAIFFLSEDALSHLQSSDGWAVGSAPTLVAVDKGRARVMNSTTLTQDLYVVVFGQRGLMAGLGLEGSKITQISPPP
jgi:lipid-binding SYLF domain-containing protein